VACKQTLCRADDKLSAEPAYPRAESTGDKVLRKPLAVIAACGLLFAVVWLVGSGNVNWADFLTQLAAALILVALGVLYWGFRPEINRAARERGGLRFDVAALIERPGEQMRQIRVRLGPEQFTIREARFALLRVKNLADRTAEDVVPLVGVPDLWGELKSLVWILPTGSPWINVEWTDTIPEFEHGGNGFASAVIHDKNTPQSVSLHGKGVGFGSVLFFTLKDSPALYFPTTAHHAVLMPCRFHMILYFQAKDLPLHRAKTYVVEADSWRRFRVSEIIEKERSDLRAMLLRRSREQSEIPVIELGWSGQESENDEATK